VVPASRAGCGSQWPSLIAPNPRFCGF
jgi:hypothetical protein